MARRPADNIRYLGSSLVWSSSERYKMWIWRICTPSKVAKPTCSGTIPQHRIPPPGLSFHLVNSCNPTSSYFSFPRSHVCNPCRGKRMRCSGDLPVCFQCTRARKLQPCVYGPPPRSRIETLSQKVRELEDQIEQLESLDTTPTPPSPSPISSTPFHSDSLITGVPDATRQMFQPQFEDMDYIFSLDFKKYV